MMIKIIELLSNISEEYLKVLVFIAQFKFQFMFKYKVVTLFQQVVNNFPERFLNYFIYIYKHLLYLFILYFL